MMRFQGRVWLLAAFFLISGFEILLNNKKIPSPTKEVRSVKSSLPVGLQNTVQVARVVDGDTLVANLDGKNEKVRIIGINTPETVDPRRAVQCFGKEASDKAKSILLSKNVKMESDLSQNDRDKYGRLLRYVFLPDGSDYGLTMIKEGYAYEYTYDSPYKYQAQYKAAQKEAQGLKAGLWADNACNLKQVTR